MKLNALNSAGRGISSFLRRSAAILALLPIITSANTIYSEANDLSLRFNRTDNTTIDLGPVAENNIPVGRSGSGNGFIREGVMMFKLPDLGAVNNPFGSVTLKVFHNSETVGAGVNGDLYGIGRRALPDVLVSDYYAPSTTPDPAATLIQDDFLVNGLGTNIQISTSISGTAALTDYFNAQYAGGAGIGEYVFLRLNPDADANGRWNIESTDDAADDSQKPQIDWLPAGTFAENLQVETADDGSGVIVPSQTLTAGDPALTVYSIARDGSDTFIENAPASWTLSNVTGSILPGDLVAAGDNLSATFTPNGPGTAEITITGSANNFIGSGTITVLAGPPSQLNIETAADGSGSPVGDTYLRLGTSIDVFAISRDSVGNFIANEATAVFSLVNITGNVIPDDLVDNSDGSANFEAFDVGTANIQASVTGFSDATSGLIVAEAPSYRWVSTASSGWPAAGHWLDGILPPFDNTTDLFFHGQEATKFNTYLQGDHTVRSLNYNQYVDTFFNIRYTQSGTTGARNLTFDTDVMGPAEINVDAGAEGNMNLGNVGSLANEYGVTILADDLLITHNGTGLLIFDVPVTETGGSKNVTLAGTGTVDYRAANTYTGTTTVNGGILMIDGDSIHDSGALVIDGGMVDVEGIEYVSSLRLGSGSVQTSGTFDAISDPTHISGPGQIIVQPIATGEINISSIVKNGLDVTLTFTSDGNVDVYRSATLGSWGAPYAVNQPSGTYTDTNADGSKYFYILVSTGDPAP